MTLAETRKLMRKLKAGKEIPAFPSLAELCHLESSQPQPRLLFISNLLYLAQRGEEKEKKVSSGGTPKNIIMEL